ncbi:unnamed protein product [Aureobasidium mustum]|uniref:F-box domain-containing protein n=1 Tax=Aureobasidium mustum TaxID=2773714 RepID=A0A9N8PN19_9PEZI|nr:unnamed protein product [Aureobasidium mustum]
MNSLPIEVLTNIISYCPTGRPSRSHQCLGPYALVSRQWQQVVERRVFSSLKLRSSELDFFNTLYSAGGGREHRRSALRKLRFIIESIPGTHEALESEPPSERAAARYRDTEIAMHVLGKLYSVLSSWSLKKAIILEIEFPPETCLSKSAIDLISTTELVKRFEFHSTAQRDPILLVHIAARMHDLQEIKWELNDYDKSINSVSRRKARYDFAKQLRSLVETCSSLRTIELRFVNETPADESIVVPSILLPRISLDHLSESLKLLSSMTRLTTLVLHSVVISEQFFEQSKSSPKTPMWPSLSHVKINYSPMVADGGWFFEQEPSSEDVERFWGLISRRIALERIHKTQEDKAKVIDFDQEYDSEPDEHEDQIDDEDGYLSDTEWADPFRIWPSQRLEAMLTMMAQTAAQMPALKVFAAGSDAPSCAPYQSFQFCYLMPGETHADDLWNFPREDQHKHKRRLYWQVPRSWRMQDDLELAWRHLLGPESIIDYRDWNTHEH